MHDSWTFKNGKDEDAVQEVFDKALTACNRVLAQLLKRFEPAEIAEVMEGMIRTHMTVELTAIKNGPKDDCWHELSEDNQAISKELHKCEDCKGYGNVMVPKRGIKFTEECKACKGKGHKMPKQKLPA